MMVLITNAVQVASITFNIVGTELFLAGGWLLCGLVLGAINILPIMLLPAIQRIHNTLFKLSHLHPETGRAGTPNEISKETSPSIIISRNRKVGLFLLDFNLFLNNFLYYCMAYVLPSRIVEFNSQDLGRAVLVYNTVNLTSLIGALLYSFIAEAVFSIFNLMLFANISFCVGCFLAFASTTESFQILEYPYQIIIGMALMGFGDAGHINLTVLSKFVLYKKWNLKNSGLGESSTTRYNVASCMSSAIGASLAWIALSRGSEMYMLGVIASIGVAVTIGLLICKNIR